MVMERVVDFSLRAGWDPTSFFFFFRFVADLHLPSLTWQTRPGSGLGMNGGIPSHSQRVIWF